MGGHHCADIRSYTKAFAIGVGLNAAYIVVEVVAGLMSNSMALLADAGHNAGDVLSLLLAWGAGFLTQTLPTKHRTYGLRRTSILASLSNAILLLLAIGAIGWEAVLRLAHPQPVAANTLMWVAGVGVIVNTATALLFLKGRKEDLNIKSAFIHMAADAGVSAGVIAAGLAIKLTGLPWIDPVISLLIVVVIAFSTWGLLRDSINLSLDAVPRGIDPDEVGACLRELPGIVEVHDLHIWGMSTTQSALTAHLVKADGQLDNDFLAQVCKELHDRFGIEHVTLQLESGAMANSECCTSGCKHG